MPSPPLQHPIVCVQPSPVKTSHTSDDIMDEEDFQTVTLDDDHWTTDPIPDRQLCIHEHSQPHSPCSYPCPYSLDSVSFNLDYAPASYHETLDLSDISEFQDVMTTSSHENVPALDDVFIL